MTYIYDAFGRLIQVKDGVDPLVNYRYNGLGHLPSVGSATLGALDVEGGRSGRNRTRTPSESCWEYASLRIGRQQIRQLWG